MSLRFASAFAYFPDEASVVDVALKAQFTHRETSAKAGCVFFAKLTYRVLQGKAIKDAVVEVAQESDAWVRSRYRRYASRCELTSISTKATHITQLQQPSFQICTQLFSTD